ncbi:hypothetical protein Cpha266_1370 [Chlorobium phaeobacteroides DSM 266]|uniref:Uncharacterized protein n=1 Tax=Chlorobium phaeobacteroides (strain DSM 266 / SMG 266 / 2430) TaxID=290317 RepID=A1BG72_CHLPD|nr:hypothetical protein Cpha266_1370 [Chlorobium phaeobacteroides DSM 266]
MQSAFLSHTKAVIGIVAKRLDLFFSRKRPFDRFFICVLGCSACLHCRLFLGAIISRTIQKPVKELFPFFISQMKLISRFLFCGVNSHDLLYLRSIPEKISAFS